MQIEVCNRINVQEHAERKKKIITVKLDISLGRADKNQQKEHMEKIPTITCDKKSITEPKYSYCVRNSVNGLVFHR